MLHRVLLFGMLSTLVIFSGKTQTMVDLEEINRNYQTCLNKGDFMLDCTISYYTKMDSMLNLAQKGFDAKGQPSWKNGQQEWLERRDAYFLEVDKEYATQEKDGFSGNDNRMIAIYKKSRFLRERVEYLISKIRE
jgi:hypothetical protein